MAKHAAQMIQGPGPRLAAPPVEQDWVALHPMHQRLVAEFEFSETTDAPLSRAARVSAIFYLGAATWMLVAGVVWGVAHAS